jgi:DNA uptake protein ComE-like DNA-binding protein
MLRIYLSAVALAASLSVQALAQAEAPGAKPQAAKPTTIVNLNTATVAELEALLGIGTKVATRIVEYRTKKRRIHEYSAH